VSRILKDALLVLLCLALIVPAALLASGRLPYQMYIVHTGSMSPTIPSRSAVIVKKGAYSLGQVIAFHEQNGVVTHRLIKRKGDGTLMTKGDANRTADSWTLEPARVIGGVVAAPRMLGYWLQYLKDPAGLASLFMLIVCSWLIYTITVELAERRQRTLAVAVERRPATHLAPGAVPPSLFADAGAELRPFGVGAPRFPGISVAVAQVVDQDRLAAVWKPVANATPVVFTCWRCGAVFSEVGELKTHVARHRAARHQERWRATSAKRSSEERFIPIGTPRTTVAQRNFG
jgi:signal peptidase I